ncbi:7379_t:CDS:2, partial [Scutellospora calospora]
ECYNKTLIMNDLDEILDFEETVDFNLSDNPDALDVEILDEDGLFSLDDIGFENSKQQDEENTKDGDNGKTQNNEQHIELDKNISGGTTQPPMEHLEETSVEISEFNLDDPYFLKGYEDANGGIDSEMNIEDEEFWKGLGVDPSDTLGKEDSKGSDLVGKLETDNSTSALPQKENTFKSSSSMTDVAKADGKKSNTSNNGKSVTRKSKSPEKED